MHVHGLIQGEIVCNGGLLMVFSERNVLSLVYTKRGCV